MSHTVEVRDLRCVAIIGALAEERERPQPIRVDLDVDLDVEVVGASDDLDDTVNYAVICDVALEILTTSRFVLLEAACDHVARAILGVDPRVRAVEIVVTKLRPPIPHDVATVGVRRRVGR